MLKALHSKSCTIFFRDCVFFPIIIKVATIIIISGQDMGTLKLVEIKPFTQVQVGCIDYWSANTLSLSHSVQSRLLCTLDIGLGHTTSWVHILWTDVTWAKVLNVLHWFGLLFVFWSSAMRKPAPEGCCLSDWAT